MKAVNQQSGCYVSEAIFIRHKDMRKKVLYENIMWIEVNGSYCDIHLITGETITVVYTLANLEKKLPDNLFFRIHRSYIINVHHVEGLIGNMVYIDKKKLPVSNPYYKELAACFNILEDTNTKMSKKKNQIGMEANRFKSVDELIKSFEEYSGFIIDPGEIDTREKLLDKISEIQDTLTFEITDNCSQYYQEAAMLMPDDEE